MKPRLMRNREALLDILYPILCTYLATDAMMINAEYKMPSRQWLLRYDVELHDSRLVPDAKLQIFGQCDNYLSVIRIATKRASVDVLATCTHEYLHAIQFYNDGAKFAPLYAQETAKHGYWDNIFEVTARQASAVFRKTLQGSAFLNRAVMNFKFLYKKPNHIEFSPEDFYYEVKPKQKDWEYKGFWTTYRVRKGLV